jgi:hypothetical protein
VASCDITDELVAQTVTNLDTRCALDADDVHSLGAKLHRPARDDGRTENLAFAERFVADHQATFERLGQ